MPPVSCKPANMEPNTAHGQEEMPSAEVMGMANAYWEEPPEYCGSTYAEPDRNSQEGLPDDKFVGRMADARAKDPSEHDWLSKHRANTGLTIV